MCVGVLQCTQKCAYHIVQRCDRPLSSALWSPFIFGAIATTNAAATAIAQRSVLCFQRSELPQQPIPLRFDHCGAERSSQHAHQKLDSSLAAVKCGEQILEEPEEEGRTAQLGLDVAGADCNRQLLHPASAHAHRLCDPVTGVSFLH